MSDPIRIDIWSDISCPWCYLGKHRLEAAVAEFAQTPDTPKVEIEYHSYQLSPDLPADVTGGLGDYLAAKLGWSPQQIAASDQRLQTLGAPYGLDYNFAINKMANTHKAHELLHYAKAHGRQIEVMELLFKAHFSNGGHVGRVDELADLAETAGLDRADALRALEAGDYAEAVEADKALAAQHGISGVPFFVLAGKYGLSGAQEPETFLNALQEVAAERTGK